jgi:hypothetical protein|tara:strand:- start:53 stop:373 length:321 start_codon:yes stop_codon:yes gene_type:complete
MAGIRHLALAVVLRALRDMQRHGAKNTTAPSQDEHLDAIIWLGSSRAALWFDVACVDQVMVLKENDWVDSAQATLDGCELKVDERQLLRAGVEVFGDLKASDSNGY